MMHRRIFRLAAAVLLAFSLFLSAGIPVAAAETSASLAAPAAADPCGLRGWSLEQGYQYVTMGIYPYYEDGSPAPVLWQVLAVEDGKALLLTTNIIDAHQPIECGDRSVAEAKKYRAVTDYGETDLNVWLNETMINDLLGDEPVLAAVTEEKYGRLYPLTDEDLLRDDFGFTHVRFYEQRSRWAYATPYTKARRLYPEIKGYFNAVQVDQGQGTSSYWVAAVKTPGKPGRYMQICSGISDTQPGDNRGNNIGHLSYGFLTRTTVGLRLAVRLDTSKIQVVSGNGSIWDPCRLAYVEDKSADAKVVVTPPPRQEALPDPFTPPPIKDRPKLETPGPDVTPVPVPEWAQ